MTLQEILEDYERQSNPDRFGIRSLSQANNPLSFKFENATNPYSLEMMEAKELMNSPGYIFNPIGSDPAFFGRNLSGYDYDPYKGTKEDFYYTYGTRPGFKYDTTGILNSKPKQNFEFLSSAYENDDEEQVEYLPGQEPKGIEKLFNFLRNIPTPMNIIRGGIDSLRGFNDRIRNTDFGRSRTLAEYFQKRRERKQAERAREANRSVYESADRQGFTNDRGGFSTDRADDRGTSEGSGQFSPSSSRGRSGY